MTTQRDRRLPFGPGACSLRRRQISQPQPVDLPDPTGPRTMRVKLSEQWNRHSVGVAS